MKTNTTQFIDMKTNISQYKPVITDFVYS